MRPFYENALLFSERTKTWTFACKTHKSYTISDVSNSWLKKCENKTKKFFRFFYDNSDLMSGTKNISDWFESGPEISDLVFEHILFKTSSHIAHVAKSLELNSSKN